MAALIGAAIVPGHPAPCFLLCGQVRLKQGPVVVRYIVAVLAF